MWSEFYSRWAKEIFKKRPSWADAVSAFSGTALGVAGAYWPQSTLVEQAWQIPIYGFVTLGIWRLLVSPYQLWKEQKEKADLVETRISQQVRVRARRPPEYLESLRAHTDVALQKYLCTPDAYGLFVLVENYRHAVEEANGHRGGMYVVLAIGEALRKIEAFFKSNEKHIPIHRPQLFVETYFASPQERFDLVGGSSYLKAHRANVTALFEFTDKLNSENRTARVTLARMHEQIAEEAKKVIAEE